MLRRNSQLHTDLMKRFETIWESMHSALYFKTCSDIYSSSFPEILEGHAFYLQIRDLRYATSYFHACPSRIHDPISILLYQTLDFDRHQVDLIQRKEKYREQKNFYSDAVWVTKVSFISAGCSVRIIQNYFVGFQNNY